MEASAQGTETVLYSFTNGVDGGYPLAGLIFDASGNLYGTTSTGGMYNQGAVFKLSPSNGDWAETTLYSFTGRTDGGTPAAGLVTDRAGDIFGTTLGGGSYGNGTIFELHATGAGWRESVLHSFGNNGDGAIPSALFVNKKGGVFGTCKSGGSYNSGTVFGAQLSNGVWQYATLYNFNAGGTDGYNPVGGVIAAPGGEHLYGTTPNGGYGRGAVFELSYSPSGWTEKIIYRFEGGNDGTTPYAGLVMNPAGNLFGTTYLGGTNNDGTVFELSPSANGWSKTTIYNASDPISPTNTEPPSLDQSGNLYSETEHTILKLTPSDGGWSAANLFQFDNTDGYWPNGGLIFDQLGNLYGTTLYGGSPFGVGVAFEITP